MTPSGRPAPAPPRWVVPVGALLGLALAAAPANGAAWYVRASGNDANAGTSKGAAFRTVGRAAAACASGDVIYVGAGTHTGNATFYQKSNVSLLADFGGVHTGDAGPVTLRAPDGGHAAVNLTECGTVYVRNFRLERNPAAHPNHTGVTVVRSDAPEVTGCVFARAVAYAHFTKFAFRYCRFEGDALYTHESAGAVENCRFVPFREGLSGEVRAGRGAHAEGGVLTFADCTFRKANYGLDRIDGDAVTLERCAFEDLADVGARLGGASAVVADCTFDRCDTALWLRDPPGHPWPEVRDTTVRDGRRAIFTDAPGLILRDVAVSGQTLAAVQVADAVDAFDIGANDTLTVTGCRFGLSWYGRTDRVQTLTVAGQTWAGNEEAMQIGRVETVDVRDCRFSGGERGLVVYDGDRVVVRDSTFSDHLAYNAAGDRLGEGVRAYAPDVELTGCTFRRCHHGLQTRGAADPDVRSCAFLDNAQSGWDNQEGSWTWLAADGLTFAGNRIGVFGKNLDWTIDGGPTGGTGSGCVVTGPAAGAFGGAYSFGLLAVEGCTVHWENARAVGCDSGLQVQGAADVLLERCSAADCRAWGLHLRNDPAGPAAFGAVTDFAATGCASGLGYRRDPATPAGAGILELRRAAVAKPTGTTAAGYTTGTTGNGFFFENVSTDPALHSDLTADGYQNGLFVYRGNLVVTPAMNFAADRCQAAVSVTEGGADVSGFVSRTNWAGAWLTPNGAAVRLVDCDLASRYAAARIIDCGAATAENCAFASDEADAVFWETTRAANWVLTDCTAAGGGDDGFDLGLDGGLGTVALTRCRAADCGDEGFNLYGGAQTLLDCRADRCANEGFDFDGGDYAAARCVAADTGGEGFRVRDATAALADCAAFRCAAEAGLLVDAAATVVADNFLAAGSKRGVEVRDPGADVTLRHATLVADDEAVRLYEGALEIVNGVLSGARYGVEASGGFVALDHALVHAPTPYEGAAPGPDDVQKDPRFRDPAAGDYRLAEGSPAINAGRDLSGVVDADRDGLPRPAHRRHDLGAHEYQEAGGSLRILEWRERAR